MSHLHLPDGVVPVPWWVLGYLLAGFLLFLAVRWTGDREMRKRLPRLAVVSALMLIAFSVPMGFLPVHLNLTVLSAVILGPWLGYLSVFLVNLILAMVGHGGITTLGINTVIVGSEVFIGYFTFRCLQGWLKPTGAALLATVFALVLSGLLMIGVLTLALAGPGQILTEVFHEHPPGTAPDGRRVGQIPVARGDSLVLTRFLSFVLPVAGAGIAVEALVTALIVGYFLRIRPDLFDPK